MAFKSTQPPAAVPDSPEKLILDLPRRKIKGVLLHQGEMMKSYCSQALNAANVALQLPTGSGKTLVGLMVGEWRRRKFQERVLYLCPTKQLVHQVVEQAEEQYGLTVRGFVGAVNSYDPSAKAEYQLGQRVGVTTYSALFNTNPFFSGQQTPDIIIVDDAHAAENYISALWAVRISRSEHSNVHTAICGLIRPLIDPANYSRLTGKWESSADVAWADKLPTPTFQEIRDEFRDLMDTQTAGSDLRFSWSMVRNHLNACQLYITSQDILLRPLIPPTWTHAPFSSAKQRIFMSATLGGGGDLERLTGCTSITRLPVPSGWDRQGIGRRYFMFPGLTLPDSEMSDFRCSLIKDAGRSLVLVPSDQAATEVRDEVATKLGYKIFGAGDIEKSKKDFVESEQAVAVVANRYDGIDFPGDSCRLLFVEGLPRATNAQERFLMSRMGANALFNDRIQTRVLQAIGRCTRSLEDYSAVVVTGEDFPNYLADPQRRRHFHPELQAELEFGIEQSQGASLKDFTENLETFLDNGPKWEEANNQIIAKRAAAVQQVMPAMGELQAIVDREIEFQKKLWQGDAEAALGAAEGVLGILSAPELKGYRALWHYLAGSAAWLGAQSGTSGLAAKARDHFATAKKAAAGIPWLVELSRFQSGDQVADDDKSLVFAQIERVEGIFDRLGKLHDRKFDAKEKEVIDGLNSKEKGPFEGAHVLLGQLLGFSAGKREVDASPDPWWIVGKLCFVFEDHAGALGTSTLDATKARQAATHPDWMRANVPECLGTNIVPVLVSPVSRAEVGALPHLNTVLFWNLSDFREWAKTALSTLRELRRTFSEPGDLVWRAQAAELFERHGLDAPGLLLNLKSKVAADILGSK
ncbi:DEAD/DEAH box helicase [Mesorhizobium sp. NBSH29]|uniref:DEAD/DEAH box helicase n=1 Tax=Mesorhizobium sp. NBSH29 TaxID=2654249 RepID=UPI001896807B|nr:helicase C-terminal domain-containing protein [Mesorhizobium sp. NBSH29]QPC87503.1 DEAD/DEAH box helicase [Mesorhizobium sp. NBSH29]